MDPRDVWIGSGQIAAVAGVSRWKTPFAAWSSLMGYAGQTDNEQIQIGIELEEPIARLACRRLGALSMTKAATVFHSVETWAKATPDFHITMPSAPKDILECKNVGTAPGPSGGAIDDWFDDDVGIVLPDYVFVQVQWQMHICERERAFVAALLEGRELVVLPMHRDPEIGEGLMDIARQFRERYILTNTPPSLPDGTEAYSKYLVGRYPRGNGNLISATPEDERLMLALRDDEKLRKACEASEKQHKQELQVRIGEADGIIGACGRVTWSERKAYTVKAHEVKATRSLRVKWKDTSAVTDEEATT